MKKIIYVTGTRADFGLMFSTLKKISLASNLDLGIIVTGMHLSKSHGYTLGLVKNSGLKIISEVKLPLKYKDNKDMVLQLGALVTKLGKLFDELKPDIVLIEGDRFEALGTAISAAFMNIVVVHVSGGDVSKSIDDSIRNAITKFAHIHLPGTDKSAERIIKMGEEPWRVKMVGTPINHNFVDQKFLESITGFNFNNPVLIVAQHPVTTEYTKALEQMKLTMEVVKELGFQTVIIYPNSDPGGEDMIKVINSYSDLKNIRIFPNLPSDVFMGLLKYSQAIIGNSSAGIVEASYFNIPCVNIGIRQEGRERAFNVIDVNHNKKEIISAINKSLDPIFRKEISQCKNPYSFENVEDKIVSILQELDLNKKLIQKQAIY